MAGFSLPDCPDFEQWLQIQREALQRHSLILLERISLCHEQMGNTAKALSYALRSIELDCWDENSYRRIMYLYTLNGQKRLALEQYQVCCQVLKKELGIMPGVETQQLAEDIRDGSLEFASIDVGTVSARQIMAHTKKECRQATVLYCDLSYLGLDEAEQAMELLPVPQARCMEIIQQFSGHIVQSFGGGLLAYFGYPQAHEHAARHTVQAGLAVSNEVFDGIEIRVAVHTGVIITDSESSMPDTLGRTSKLAILLCQ
ncbi:MAG: BTAD domain-containing putative transcriptional regulator, partial [Pseudomonadota bacterium]